MPGSNDDYSLQTRAAAFEARRQKLIAKGLVEGTTKFSKLLYGRRFR